jgi:hypothetical protein
MRAMSVTPLTHHEILELVEPFARQGRHVDLAASDRARRRLQFKPIDHPGTPAQRELLQLDSRGNGSFKLTRTLTRPDGAQATLEAQGADPGELLQRIQGVDRAQHFVDGPGYAIARSYLFEAYASGGGALALARGVVHVDGATLAFDVPAVKGVSANLSLQSLPGQRLTPPEDLLAVIGWNWARLVPEPDGWTSRMRLRGSGEARSRKAEAALETAARHLAQTLAEPPARFHDRHLWARWGVVLRRMIPTLTAVGLIAGTVALPRIATNTEPSFWLALHYVPIGILALAFTLQELPRFEIPAWPRRSRAKSWWQPLAPAQGDTCSATP